MRSKEGVKRTNTESNKREKRTSIGSKLRSRRPFSHLLIHNNVPLQINLSSAFPLHIYKRGESVEDQFEVAPGLGPAIYLQQEKVCVVFPFTEDKPVVWTRDLTEELFTRAKENVEEYEQELGIVLEDGDEVEVMNNVLAKEAAGRKRKSNSIIHAQVSGAGVSVADYDAKVCGDGIALYNSQVSLEHRIISAVGAPKSSHKGARVVVAGEEKQAVAGQNIRLTCNEDTNLSADQMSMSISGACEVEIAGIVLNRRLYERVPREVWATAIVAVVTTVVGFVGGALRRPRRR